MTESKLLDDILLVVAAYPDWFGRHLAVEILKEYLQNSEAEKEVERDSAFDCGYQEAINDHNYFDECCDWDGDRF